MNNLNLKTKIALIAESLASKSPCSNYYQQKTERKLNNKTALASKNPGGSRCCLLLGYSGEEFLMGQPPKIKKKKEEGDIYDGGKTRVE